MVVEDKYLSRCFWFPQNSSSAEIAYWIVFKSTKKPTKFFVMIAALASKKRSNQKNKGTLYHGFPLHPNRSRDSRAIWPTCGSIPRRSWEQNQQNQWWKTLQIFSLPIYRNSHPARQCFVRHGYNWINGKTWGIELPITYLPYLFWLNDALAAHWKFIFSSFCLIP